METIIIIGIITMILVIIVILIQLAMRSKCPDHPKCPDCNCPNCNCPIPQFSGYVNPLMRFDKDDIHQMNNIDSGGALTIELGNKSGTCYPPNTKLMLSNARIGPKK